MQHEPKQRTASEEHWMAQQSALYTVERTPGATLQDVMKQQGLCEIRAALALSDLVRHKKVVRIENRHYLPKDAPPKRGKPKW